MIDLEFLERLIAAVDSSSLDSIELERGGTRVRLSKTPEQSVTVGTAPAAPAAPAPPPTPAASPASPDQGAPAAEASHLIEVTSPMVGTFYQAPAPDAPPYVSVGDSVGEGDTLCIIEAMKLMNELEAELAGKIVEICVDNAEPVEYGQVLFRIDPS